MPGWVGPENSARPGPQPPAPPSRGLGPRPLRPPSGHTKAVKAQPAGALSSPPRRASAFQRPSPKGASGGAPLPPKYRERWGRGLSCSVWRARVHSALPPGAFTHLRPPAALPPPGPQPHPATLMPAPSPAVRMEVPGRTRENLERSGGHVRASRVCPGGTSCGFREGDRWAISGRMPEVQRGDWAWTRSDGYPQS